MLTVASLSSNGIHVDEKGGVTIPAKLGSDYRLCRAEGNGTEFKLRYLRDRWEYFNKHLFGGVMKEPNFVISPKVKVLGLWRAGRRELEIGKRMFLLAHDRETLNTIIHEMCHQYVSEVLRAYGAEAGPTGHGPAWQRTMQGVGLPPDDKFYGDRDDITKKEVLVRREEKKHLLTVNEKPKEADEYRVLRYINPETGVDCPVLVLPNKNIDAGDPTFIGCLVNKDGEMHKAVYLRRDRLVVPGPLKIQTPLYRKAKELLEQYKAGEHPTIRSLPKKM